VKDVMAPRLAEVRSGALAARVTSALIMAPAVLAATYFGGTVFNAVVVVLGVVLAWEWSRLCGGASYTAVTVVMAAALIAGIGANSLGHASWLSLVLPLGLGAVAAFSWYARADRKRRGERAASSYPLWTAGGYLYITATCLALLRIRGDAVWGLATILWLFAVVWAADSGAYAFGRAIGGPKLAPKISPNKTWAGFLGGTACAGAAGGIVGMLVGAAAAAPLVAAGLCLGVVSHTGDLFESWMKRYFNFKDSGTLIPGHGGLFDRVDGLMAASVALGAAGHLSGRSLLAWF